ncbi:hypothetical protein SAMN05444156_0707 [Verrucomicrobium sp. GAS474]|nr:hypothetical protein SAMN05444156_0707 [Verrucomicrobium sp. GAS474]
MFCGRHFPGNGHIQRIDKAVFLLFFGINATLWVLL